MDTLPASRTRKSPRRSSRRGAAVVEFALTVPIFFLFLLAAFEFGWLNVMRHTADNAAYEAARNAIVPGATAAEARAKADEIMEIVGARGTTVTVTPTVLTPSTDKVTVSVDVPMISNALVVPRITGKHTIHGSATLRTERAN